MNFNNLENPKRQINALKGEHLKSSELAIVECLHNREDMDEKSEKYFREFEKNAEFIDFKSRTEKFQSEITGDTKEVGTYTISSVSNTDKYSKDFLDCTGVLFVGTGAEFGKNISFMSHQNPDALFHNTEVREKFKIELNDKIDTLIKHCLPKTVDVVIFGGNDKKEDISDILLNDFSFDMNKINENYDDIYSDKNENYRKSIKFLNHIISIKLGYSPVVISGFNDKYNENNNSATVYFDNDKRQLHIVRPRQDTVNNESFLASDVEAQIEKINKQNEKSK